MNDARQQIDEHPLVRGAEAKVPSENPHRVLHAASDYDGASLSSLGGFFAVGRSPHLAVTEPECVRRVEEQEVARLQRDRLVPMHQSATA